MRVLASVVLTLGALSDPALAADPYGGVSLSGIRATDSSLDATEELDGSAIVARGYAGIRLNPKGDSSRFQVASSYHGYFNREDRWSNAIEAEQSVRLGRSAIFSLEATAATNLLTLERRSTDQAGVVGRLTLEPANHRVTLEAGTRRRWYDGTAAKAWAPFVGAEYRYRIGSWHSISVEGRAERVDSNLATLNYDRLEVAAFYTRPLRRGTRIRLGMTHRRWTWESRFTPSGAQRRERLWLPQVRLTHELRRDLDLELDARRVIRRSNDPRFERTGSRLAATIRKTF